MAIFFLRKHVFLLLLMLQAVTVLPGCHQRHTRKEEVIARKQLMYDIVHLDSVPMNSPVFYRDGFFRVRNNHIYVFDYDPANVQVFDTTGRFLDTLLTYHTIQEFRYGGFTPEGNIYLLDQNNRIRIFDSSGIPLGPSMELNWQRTKLNYTEAEYTTPGTYSIDVQERPFDTRWLSFDAQQRLLIPLWISPHINRNLNRYRWNSGYYRQAALLGAVQLKDARVQAVLGKRSSVYETYNNIPGFDFASADVRNDTLYVSAAIDSAVQVYGPDNTYLYAFGCSGKNMNQQYPEAANEKEDKANSSKALSASGYYYHLFCDPGSDFIFRSHTTHEGAGSGLQVYQGNTLVAEAQVPQRFNVVGKIGNWYYADGMVSQYNKLLGVYRFQLRRRSP